MRPFRLARIAAEAEGVRLRGLANRVLVRLLLALIALIFLLGALGFAHLAAWYCLRMLLDQTFLASTGIMGGADIVIAGLLVFLASRSTPSRVELDAIMVRRQAIEGIAGSLSLLQLALPVIRIVTRLLRRARG